MEANSGKFQLMLLHETRTLTDFSIVVNGNTLVGEKHVKLLGVDIDNHLDFHFHIDTLCTKAVRQLDALARIHCLLARESQIAIIRSFITSNFNYCPLVWHFCGSKLIRFSKSYHQFIYLIY